MRTGWGVLAVFVVAGPSIAYFRYERPVQPATSNGQHFAVVDELVWSHSRSALSDVRLYATGKELPLALTTEMGNSATEQKILRVLQPGTLGGKTQFLLDMSGTEEYDRVTLRLAAKNFVAHARVEGQDDPHGTKWVTLGTTTLYDLSNEKLGQNSALQIPLSTYRFLRVTIDGVAKPWEVESATASTTRAEKAVWREVNSAPTREQIAKDTVFVFAVPENVPAERIDFTMEAEQANFLRSVEILDDKEQPVSTGEISRIHMQRNGQKIDVEESSVSARFVGPGKYRVVIRNGDDAPLKIAGARLQQHERRIYFDSDTGAQLQLYYGDEKLGAPVYDYRKLFQKDANAGQLQFGPEVLNAAYTGRPDERPWSERNPAVLWLAIVAAVLILGGIAYRSIKSVNT